MKNIGFVLNKVTAHHQRSLESINLTPSENVLSPLARVPFLLDAYSRYFLDDLRLFGDWSFPSGKDLGDIEQQTLIPLLKDLAKAKYVNVRPISGINCMTVSLAGLCDLGDIIYSVPVSVGGHPSTFNVAKRLGLSVKEIPFSNEHDVDLKKLTECLIKENPAMIYLDQATFLFPIDPQPIRDIIDQNGLKTIIHYDSSHTNGLILGGTIENPLDAGAHCFGGSTHKTLPGPHKGFFATNDEKIHKLIQEHTDHFISHHHMASIVSLAIVLLEFRDCGGVKLMQQIHKNTRVFCTRLESHGGFDVIGADRGYTKTHQIWIKPKEENKTKPLNKKLVENGIILNCFGGLPGVGMPAYRLSLSEFSRLGANESDAVELAECFIALEQDMGDTSIKDKVVSLRRRTSNPQYCYDIQDVPETQLLEHVNRILRS